MTTILDVANQIVLNYLAECDLNYSLIKEKKRQKKIQKIKSRLVIIEAEITAIEPSSRDFGPWSEYFNLKRQLEKLKNDYEQT